MERRPIEILWLKQKNTSSIFSKQKKPCFVVKIKSNKFLTIKKTQLFRLLSSNFTIINLGKLTSQLDGRISAGLSAVQSDARGESWG